MTSTASPATTHRPLLHALAHNWWLILLRGIAAIVFGVLAFIWPGLTLFTLIIFYGAFALVDGVMAIDHGDHRPGRLRRAGGSRSSASSA